MGDREKQQKFAQNSTIRNSEFDRQNTNLLGRSNTDNMGNVLPTDIENRKSPHLKLIIINFVGVVLGIGFFIYIVPLGRYFVSKEFYSGASYLFFSLIATFVFIYLAILLGKIACRIKLK
ncbi:hypothetical protein ACYSNR_07165 [Enterococcus sp. LJL128]